MSVTTRQTFRRRFESTVPVLTPLYSAACPPRTLSDEGSYLCGSSDACDLRLRIDGVEPEHCALLFRTGALSVRRGDGRIWVNDLPVREECELSLGDVLSVGPLSFLVGESEAARQTAPANLKSHDPSVQINDRNSATTEHLESLARKAEQLAERELALSFRSNDVAAQHQALKEFAESLAQRSAELDLQAAVLTLRSDALALHKSRENSESSSVEQITAIAAEKEAAVRARQEAFAAQENTHRILAGLESRASDVSAAEARLAALERATRAAVCAADTEREALQNGHKDLLCERNSLVQFSHDLSSRESSLNERELMSAQQAGELRSRFDALQVQSAELRKEELELNSRAADIHRRVTQFKSEVRVQRQQKDAAPATASESDSASVSACDDHRVSRLTQTLLESETQRAAAIAEQNALMAAVRELQHALENSRTDAEEAGRIRSRSAQQEQAIAHLYQSLEERSQELQRNEARLKQTVEQFEQLQTQVDGFTQGRDTAVAGSDGIPSAGNLNFGVAEAEARLLEEIESLRFELNQSASADALHQSQFSVNIKERDRAIREYQSELESVRSQLAEFNAAHSGANDRNAFLADELQRLRTRLEDMDELLQERDQIIGELQSRLTEQIPAPDSAPFDREELQYESRELDRRAGLLDQRDDELRERTRLIEQSEGEVEGQRRQLLDARQQLELARAEIQVAMKQHSSPAVLSSFTQSPSRLPDSGVGTGSDAFDAARSDRFTGSDNRTMSFSHATVDDSTDHAGGESGTDLRSELAGLFGVKIQFAESMTEPLLPVTDFVDLSEAAGASSAVAYHFGNDASRIVENVAASDAQSAPEATGREGNSDDFVRDYMEQLLSRSRKAAGNTLPNELKATDAKPTAQPSAAVSQKKTSGTPTKSTPRVKSYIEQYMSGGFGDLTGDGSMMARPEQEQSAVETIDDSVPQTRPERLTPRVRVDVQKLRENMVSFRSVSTQSAENALVNHALRQQRHAVNGRIVFMVVLLAMTVFLAVANAHGIIGNPLMMWVILTAAIGTAAELARTLYNVKMRVKGVLMPDDPNTLNPDRVIPMPETEDLSPVEIPVIGTSDSIIDPCDVPSGEPIAGAEARLGAEATPADSEIGSHCAAPKRAPEFEENERSRYFEL